MIVNVEVVVLRSDKVLLVKRSEDEDYMPGIWSLPGGKVEPENPGGDILEKTAQREVDEEVGISVHPDMVYLESKLFYADKKPTVDVVFLCRYLSGQAYAKDRSEISAVKWLEYEKARCLDELPAWTQDSLHLAAEVIEQMG